MAVKFIPDAQDDSQPPRKASRSAAIRAQWRRCAICARSDRFGYRRSVTAGGGPCRTSLRPTGGSPLRLSATLSPSSRLGAWTRSFDNLATNWPQHCPRDRNATTMRTRAAPSQIPHVNPFWSVATWIWRGIAERLCGWTQLMPLCIGVAVCQWRLTLADWLLETSQSGEQGPQIGSAAWLSDRCFWPWCGPERLPETEFLLERAMVKDLRRQPVGK
jgi:hypothetical protein